MVEVVESNPMSKVYAVFYRLRGSSESWRFYGTASRRQSSFYDKPQTAQSIASRAANDDNMYSNSAYEYKVMQLEGEWSDID